MIFYTNVARKSNDILCRGYKDGKRFNKKIKYKPFIFTDATNPDDTPYRTLDGKPAERVDFDSMFACNQFIKQYKDVEGFGLYGLDQFPYLFISECFPEEIQFDYNLISVVTIDIEVSQEGGNPNIELADKEILTITVRKNNDIYCFGYKEYEPKTERTYYYRFDDEGDLLIEFLDILRELDPDIISGWNVEMFDIPYIIHRINRVLGQEFTNQLSPWGLIDSRVIEGRFGKPQTVYTIIGVTVLDYLQLYKKFSYSPQERYNLDYIAHVELQEKKIDYHEYGNLKTLYRENFTMYMDYNIHDVNLVYRLDVKMKLIEQCVTLAYKGKVNYIDAFTSVRLWDIIIHNFLLERKVVVPRHKDNSKMGTIVGAYVKDPLVGAHKWVVSFDFTSLYPKVIQQFNISPDTFQRMYGFRYGGGEKPASVDDIIRNPMLVPTEYLQKNNETIAANMALFSKNKQGFLPAIMEQLFKERAEFKKKMLTAEKELEAVESRQGQYANISDAEHKRLIEKYTNEVATFNNNQQARKIILNAGYGALSNEGYRFFDVRLAEAVTYTGQLAIRWLEVAMNEHFNQVIGTVNTDYIIACDTDSMYVNCGPLLDKLEIEEKDRLDYLNNFCNNELQKFINQRLDELYHLCNCFAKQLHMKREIIADSAIWTAKKHYVANVWDKEGVRYKTPHLKIMGLQAIKSSIPIAARTEIKKGIEYIVRGDHEGLMKFCRESYEKFKNLPFEEFAFPRSVTDIDKWADPATIFKKGTPIHCKGALIYNHHLKLRGLDSQYPLISNGDKIKFAKCRQPNPLLTDVIAVPLLLPEEFGMRPHIDFEQQFEQIFIDPLRSLTDVLKWVIVEDPAAATLDAYL